MTVALSFVPPSHARLRRLLARGYFPSELPPPFTADDFARHSSDFASMWEGPKIRKFWSRPEHYSVPRYGHARRLVSIVNPVNQLHVADLIATNWTAIRKRLKRSEITEFDPRIVLKGPGRSVTGVNFDGVARRRAEILGSYGRYVKTDVARFYPSIYTHSLAWALAGKDFAKKNHHDPAFKGSAGNLIDKAVAAGQEGQTIGIPIGPDTSRILSELIAVEVEILLGASLVDLKSRAVRYVDDMLIGLKDTETASAILSGLSTALYEYELELSAEKTMVRGMGCPHSPEWVNYIRTFELSARIGRQRDDLDSFFEQAFYLSDENSRENVLLFAAKRAASFNVDVSNRPHLIRWLLYAARRSPSSLSFVAEFLASAAKSGLPPSSEIEAFILQQIPIKAEAVHTDELAWLLFWAREIGLTLPATLLEKVIPLRSSVVALITMDLRQRGQVDGTLRLSSWRAAAKADGLKSEMWLVAYEATKKGWWQGRVSPAFIKNHAFFGDIWDREVEFYDSNRKARKRVRPPFSTMRLSADWHVGSSAYPE